MEEIDIGVPHLLVTRGFCCAAMSDSVCAIGSEASPHVRTPAPSGSPCEGRVHTTGPYRGG